jgi:hypothetical protein
MATTAPLSRQAPTPAGCERSSAESANPPPRQLADLPGGGADFQLLLTGGPASTNVLCWVFGRFDVASVLGRIQRVSNRASLVPQAYLFDRQGWSTLFAGILLLLISFTTNYGDDNLFHLSSLPAHDKGLF